MKEVIYIELAAFKRILTKTLDFQQALQEGRMKATSLAAVHNLKEILLVLDPSQEAFPLTQSVESFLSRSKNMH